MMKTPSGFDSKDFSECGACGKFFLNPDGFFRCWICLKKDRGWTLTKGDNVLEAQMEATDKLYREYKKLSAQPPQRVVKRVITLDKLANKRLRSLLKLCHPDKHVAKSQEVATEITSWLLAIKTHAKTKK